MAGLDEFYSGRSGFAPGKHRLSRGLKERQGENSKYLLGKKDFPVDPKDVHNVSSPAVAGSDPKLLGTRPGTLATPAHRKNDPYSDQGEKMVVLGMGVTGLLADNLLSHPFVVLRRQCQVNIAAYHAHTTPFTLVPVMIGLHRWQGIGCLWKGLGSTLTVRGLTLAAEDLASKFTPWPKEVDSGSSLRLIGQHLLLKSVSLGLVTPFYSASLVESVQSEIASIFDVFREGMNRLACWQSPASGRMLPVWVLLPPTVIHGVSHYIIYTLTKGLATATMKRKLKQEQAQQGAVAKDQGMVYTEWSQYQDQISSLVGHLTADILLYPAETVLHRLHLQGCRTIVDNLDSGREVIPIMTRYEGFVDCLFTALDEEGFRGLLKGLGALILQYTLHYALIRFSASLIREGVKFVRNESSTAPAEIKAKLEQDLKSAQVPAREHLATSTPISAKTSNPASRFGSGAGERRPVSLFEGTESSEESSMTSVNASVRKKLPHEDESEVA